MAFIEASDVTVVYPVYGASDRSLKNRVINQIGGGISGKHSSYPSVTALEVITLCVRPGDRVALIGGNGSGKSTLLRVLAGILEPVSGRIEVSGSVSSLIDMGMGMDPDATGYENIVMRSVFLGATFSEARARIPEIEAFSELGEFLQFPLRTYSTGMSLRLSFAITTSMRPDIMVIDEMIGVGDAAFASRALARIQDLAEKLDILVVSTHDLHAAQSLCSRGVILSRGRLVVDAPISEAIIAYRDMTEGGSQ